MKTLDTILQDLELREQQVKALNDTLLASGRVAPEAPSRHGPKTLGEIEQHSEALRLHAEKLALMVNGPAPIVTTEASIVAPISRALANGKLSATEAIHAAGATLTAVCLAKNPNVIRRQREEAAAKIVVPGETLSERCARVKAAGDKP